MWRFIPDSLFRGQFKSIANYSNDQTYSDWISRAIVYGVPLAAGTTFWLMSGKLAAPAGLLSGLMLMAGALLGVFAQVSNWRDRLTAETPTTTDPNSTNRDYLDETATHILAASYMSAVSAMLIVVAMNVAADCDGALVGPLAGIIVTTASFVFLVFIITLPRLYYAYTNVHNVRDELSGTKSG